MVKDTGLAQCVPNFSEGRRADVIESVIGAFKGARGCRLLDHSSDQAHNRTVVTLVGPLSALVESALAGISEALRLIDMNEHSGGHPRLGAVDVVPFIPLGGTDMDDCVDGARALGERVARDLDLPVFLYEEAARDTQRGNLAFIRKGEYEGLAESMTQAGRDPDFGPSRPHPTGGAVVIGARRPLIAYNINLATRDLRLARRIARGIRGSGGGFVGVKGMGLETEDGTAVQVSMNLTDFTRTPIHKVFEVVRMEAERYGVPVRESEIVGLVPAQALVDAACHYLRLNHFEATQVLEQRLLEEAF